MCRLSCCLPDTACSRIESRRSLRTGGAERLRQIIFLGGRSADPDELNDSDWEPVEMHARLRYECCLVADLNNMEAAAAAHILLDLLMKQFLRGMQSLPKVLMRGETIREEVETALMIPQTAVADFGLLCLFPGLEHWRFSFRSSAPWGQVH